jgi:hypothetical protein
VVQKENVDFGFIGRCAIELKRSIVTVDYGVHDRLVAKSARALRVLPAAVLAICFVGCQAPKSIEKPLFVGNPDLARVYQTNAENFSAPTPAFKQLKLSVQAPGDRHVMGTIVETLGATANGAGRYTEQATYNVLSGKCVINNRADAVGVGGFVVLQEVAESWSPDCEGNSGYRRREVTSISRSGALFPLKVGNRLSLRYTEIGTDRGRDEGVADYEETSEETYEVVERLADYRAESGRNVGEVFVIRVEALKAGKKRKYTFLFSTVLNWRIGYSTEVRVVLVDWIR